MPLPATSTTNVSVSVDTETTTVVWPALARFFPGGAATQITRTVGLGTPPPGWESVSWLPIPADSRVHVPLLGAEIGYDPAVWRINAWHGCQLQVAPVPGEPPAIHPSGQWTQTGMGLYVHNGRTGAPLGTSAFLLATVTGYVSLQQAAAA